MMNNPFEELNIRLERIEGLIAGINIPDKHLLPEKLMTTKEICDFLGITEPTLIRRKKKGQIPFLEIGGAIRFDKTAVIRALEKKSNK
jgi:excisionase family DNA binding protein